MEARAWARLLCDSAVEARRICAYHARMSGLIYVAAGGAIGASCRHLLSKAVLHRFGPDASPLGFPVATFCANIIGSFLMGLLVGWLALKISGGDNIRLFLGVGVLGGFTTFSAFSLEAMLLLERKAYGPMVAYIGLSVMLSLAALFIGLIIARKVFAL